MNDIAELFARDPLSLTHEDIDSIIERMRQARTQFNLGNIRAGSTKPSKPSKRIEGLEDLLKGIEI